MKKIILLFLLISVCAAWTACGSDAEDTASSEKGISSEEAVSSQEYSGVIYTTREDGEEGTYILKDHTDKGVLLRERAFVDDILKYELFYLENGQVSNTVFYTVDGEVDYRSEFTRRDNQLVETFTNSDGSHREKIVYNYIDGVRIQSVLQYDDKDVLVFRNTYNYDGAGRLVSEGGELLDGSFVISSYTYYFDAASGVALKLEEVDFDSDYKFKSHEVYKVIDGDIGDLILIERYDENGNSLPLD